MPSPRDAAAVQNETASRHRKYPDCLIGAEVVVIVVKACAIVSLYPRLSFVG